MIQIIMYDQTNIIERLYLGPKRLCIPCFYKGIALKWKWCTSLVVIHAPPRFFASLPSVLILLSFWSLEDKSWGIGKTGIRKLISVLKVHNFSGSFHKWRHYLRGRGLEKMTQVVIRMKIRSYLETELQQLISFNVFL